MLKIGFFGTPHLAACVLRDLADHGEFEISLVVTNPDKPIGRSGKVKPSPVKELAVERNIAVLQPERIRGNEQFFEEIHSHGCDYFVVVAYGKILSRELLEIPKKMCINVHGSLLPKYRGASPIQSALLSGETETGVTIMQMSEGMDEGDMILIEKIPISEHETSGSLFEKFGKVSGKTLIQALLSLEEGSLHPVPQDHTKATYCKKIEKEDGSINWRGDAEDIYHQWQAYTPWPGIYTLYEGKRLLLEKVGYRETSQDTPPEIQKEPGTVVKFPDNQIGIVCGKDILTLEQVKLEGKKSQHIRDFVNGNQKFLTSHL